MTVRPAKTQISLGIRFLHADSEDWSNGWMPRLIWVFAGRTVILLVLSRGGSYRYYPFNNSLEILQLSQRQGITKQWKTLREYRSKISQPSGSSGIKIPREMSHLMTKTTQWHVRPAKTQISLGIRPAWSESSLSAFRTLRSLATHWARGEDWSDWADAQADLSLGWAHRSFCWFCYEAAQLGKLETTKRWHRQTVSTATREVELRN